MMKDAFHFILKTLLVLKIFKFLYWPFGHIEKQLDQKDKVNFKIHDVTNNYNTHIAQYLQSKGIKTIKFGI